MRRTYRDRWQAGRLLAAELGAHAGVEPMRDPLVLALPRGGVPVAFEVAAALGAELDVLVVRKLGVPGHPELAMGAVALGGALVLNEQVVGALGIPRELVEQAADVERRELERRAALYRETAAPPRIAGRTVILVDDGLATGATMRAAIAAVRTEQPESIVVAVPVAAAITVRQIAGEADAIVCPLTPDDFYAVGAWYQDFDQVDDAEVQALLRHGRRGERWRESEAPE